jgi:hypothetical protein
MIKEHHADKLLILLCEKAIRDSVFYRCTLILPVGDILISECIFDNCDLLDENGLPNPGLPEGFSALGLDDHTRDEHYWQYVEYRARNAGVTRMGGDACGSGPKD